MTAYSVLGFKKPDPILQIQKSFDHVLEYNPHWIESYIDKLKTFTLENQTPNQMPKEGESSISQEEFLNSIESIIEKLGNPISVKKEVSKLAAIYESLGITKKEFPKLVPILLSTLRENLPSEWNPNLESIWTQVIMDLTIETIES